MQDNISENTAGNHTGIYFEPSVAITIMSTNLYSRESSISFCCGSLNSNPSGELCSMSMNSI